MNYNVPIFHPVENRGNDYYHPGNHHAQHLMRVQHIYSDIARLFEIVNKLSDLHEKVLVLKYAIIELVSLDDAVEKLANGIIVGKPAFSLTKEHITQVRILYQAYKNNQQAWGKIKTTRDKLGAHRDLLPLQDVADLIDSISPKDILANLSGVAPFFNYVKALNIYTWVKRESTPLGDVMAFIQPLTLSKKEK